MLRILLADHHASAIWALRTMLHEERELEIAGEAADGQSLMDLSGTLHPDLILMDRELPGSPVGDLIAALHRLKPRPIVIVMSSDPQYGRMCLNDGADAFVSKGDQPEWLLQSLHKFAEQAKKKGETESSPRT